MPLDTNKPLNSLGFPKSPAETRVVVAMSGGVDSSVVAAHLAAEGYDVVGVTLQLYDHGAALAKKGACCAGIDIHDARRVAEDGAAPRWEIFTHGGRTATGIDAVDFARPLHPLQRAGKVQRPLGNRPRS